MVPKNVYNAMVMYGYEAPKAQVAALTHAYGKKAEALFSVGDALQRFRSRWAVRQLVDTGVRAMVRPDLSLRRAREDLYYPASYTKQVSARALAAQLAAVRRVKRAPRIQHHGQPPPAPFAHERARQHKGLSAGAAAVAGAPAAAR